MWLCLAALSASMLMATTNQLCLDVAVVPLLWLLPMGLYLLSFILCFHSERWYSRFGFGVALFVALGQTCWVLSQGIYIALPIQILSYAITLFVCCMICNGELVRLKPAPSHLTAFYLDDFRRVESFRRNLRHINCSAYFQRVLGIPSDACGDPRSSS